VVLVVLVMQIIILVVVEEDLPTKMLELVEPTIMDGK
tara:strand:- start:323 stop:433 length:111 start_codon:yes stop_codon:yes gene_type:complete